MGTHTKKPLTPEQKDRAKEFLRLLGLSKWTPAEAARRLGFHPGNISQYKAGDSAPDKVTLNFFSDLVFREKPELLGKDPSRFASAEEGSQPEPMGEVAAVQQKIAELPPAEFKTAEQFVEFLHKQTSSKVRTAERASVRTAAAMAKPDAPERGQTPKADDSNAKKS